MSSILSQGRSLIFRLSGEVHSHTADQILENNGLFETKPDVIILDLTAVRLVKPAGACFIACLVTSVLSRQEARVPIRIVGLSEGVESYLATLGFFSILRAKAELLGCERLLELESKRRERRD